MDNGPVDQATGDSDNDGVGYTVEAIVARRLNENQLEYLVKWKDFPDEDNTWELPQRLNCPKLISQFEAHRCTLNRKRQAELATNQLYEAKAKKLKIAPSLCIDNPFDYGYKAEEILYALNKGNKISLVIKFMELDQPEQVDSSIACAHTPQLVLKFYELHLRHLHAFSNCSDSSGSPAP